MAARPWADAVARANADAKQPVVFIHDLRLTPRAWDRWADIFEETGYVALTPPWPPTVPDGPSPGAIGQAARSFAELAQALSSRPAIVGHGLGALVAQVLAGEGLSAATVAIAPPPLPDRGLAQIAGWADPRGPLLVLAGRDDRAAGLRRADRGAAPEFVELPGPGDALIEGAGWRDVAETALTFIQRFV